MTIRFVKYWNGYSPDAIVHNLGSTEEVRLVSLGYATTDLDGPGTPEGELVRTVTGPNGEVSLQAGGSTVPLDKSRGELIFVAIGDSITARDEGDRASGLNGPRSDGSHTVMEMLLGGGIEVTGIYATGGYTVEQVAATHLPTALAATCDGIYVRCGVNDCLADTDGTTTFNLLKSSIIDPILAADKLCIVSTITYSASMTTAGRAAMLQMNHLIRALAGYHKNLKISDDNAVMSAATTGLQRTAPSTCYVDVTHPNQAGAFWLASSGVNAYKKLGVIQGIGKVRKPVGSPYGIATNPRVAGNNATGTNKTTLGTGISGTGPDGWNVNRSGATNTAVSSCVARTDDLDGYAHQLALTLTNAGEPVNVFPASGAALFIRGTGTTYQRANSAAYIQGEIRRWSDGRIYKVVTAGTSAAAEPSPLPTTVGDVIVDNTAVWMLLPDFVGDATYAMRLVTDFQVTAQSGLLTLQHQLKQYGAGYANLSSGVQGYSRLTNGFVTAGQNASAWGAVHGPVCTDLSKGYDALPQNRIMTLRTPWVRLHAETNVIEPQIRFGGAAGTTATVQILGSEVELAVI